MKLAIAVIIREHQIGENVISISLYLISFVLTDIHLNNIIDIALNYMADIC